MRNPPTPNPGKSGQNDQRPPNQRSSGTSQAIHHEPAQIHVPLTEFARVLRPGGTLLLGYFDGTAIEPFDHAVVRAYRWPAGELSAALDAAGFDIIETHRRTERGRRDVGALLGERRAH